MRILVTGATGNIGKGIVPILHDAGHQLVLSDLGLLPESLKPFAESYHQLDIQTGFGLDRAAAGCDMILHLPAWHGIHWQQKTEIDFWQLNVNGTFNAFQAARANGIKKFVFLSSQAWHGHYDKYGFTKRVGEELCEYHKNQSGISYVAIRPADLTPWSSWAKHYGPRLLYGGVDRGDVLESIRCSVQYLGSNDSLEGFPVDALRANAFTADQIEGWESDPLGTCESIFPGYRDLIEKYGLDITRKPSVIPTLLGAEKIGYQPKTHFGTFLQQLRERDNALGQEEVQNIMCDYARLAVC
ncbi:MAG TPA: NAD(P)-dependent oxidoreductase [Fimbriimonas sp.]|nr:NAD(P)-dependent oxidoreductase [Fimbriimonas sp.]